MAGDAQALVDLIASCDTNTFAMTGAADSADVDDYGNAYAAGAPLLTDAEGNVICLDKASATVAEAGGSDENGTVYPAGAEVISIPGYGDIAIVGSGSIDNPNGSDSKIVTLSDGTQIKVENDPVVSEECVEGQKVITYCSGRQVCETWDYVEIITDAGDTGMGPFDDDGGLQIGDQIPGSVASVTVPNWPCPQNVMITTTHSLVSENDFDGSIGTRPRYRIQGNPNWTEMIDGGSDSLETQDHSADEPQTKIGEFEFRNTQDLRNVPGGSVIEFDLKIQGMTDPLGRWDVNRADYKVSYWACRRTEI